MSFSRYRQYFPITSTDIYLNHAALSPLSTKVLEAIHILMEKRSSGIIEVFPEFIESKKRLKQNLATLIGAESQNIAIIGNTSEGLNWLARGLPWQQGDRILLVEKEFPANIYPFLNLKDLGVEIDFVPVDNGHIHIGEIEKKIYPGTRLLSISFVEFLNGFRNPLKEIGQICKTKGIIFSVDSIQGLGALTLNVEEAGIDFLSNGGHKWLMGPLGCGFMYISSTIFGQVKPAFMGWLSVKDSWNFLDYNPDLLDDAGRFEIGTGNVLGITGLGVSTDLLLEAGVDRIEKHLKVLGGHLIDGLTDLGYKYIGSSAPKEQSGIYSFTGPQEQEFFNYLQEKRIHISLRGDVLRFAPHFYNTIGEMEEVLRICEAFKNM